MEQEEVQGAQYEALAAAITETEEESRFKQEKLQPMSFAAASSSSFPFASSDFVSAYTLPYVDDIKVSARLCICL